MLVKRPLVAYVDYVLGILTLSRTTTNKIMQQRNRTDLNSFYITPRGFTKGQWATKHVLPSFLGSLGFQSTYAIVQLFVQIVLSEASQTCFHGRDMVLFWGK